jgi:hypothetical protein
MTLRAVSAALLTGFFSGGCSPKALPEKHSELARGEPAQAPAPTLPGLPVDFTVKQRSTTAVPGSEEALHLTIGDITRGQTMVTLAGKDEAVLLSTRSMKWGAAAEFKFGGETLTLTLREFHDALIDEDFAAFTLSRGPAQPTPGAHGDEMRKIALLLEHVKNMEGATFVRNGSDHSPKDAAEHLESKLAAANRENMTAPGFIDIIASKSLVTDEVYTIRLKDGSTVPTGEYLRKELEKIEHP